MERGARTKLAAAAVLVAVFASGLLLGFVADDRLEVEPAATGAGAPMLERPAGGERERGRRPRVYEQVNPSAEQTALIDSIFSVHRERMNELDHEYRAARHEYKANYDAVIQDTRDAIAAVFSAEQAAEYRRLLVEFDRRREAERASRGDRK